MSYTEMDLLEETRRDDVYLRINEVIYKLQNLGVHPSLVWVYVWDIVKDKLDYYHPDSGEDYVINNKLTEKDVWDLFWTDAESKGFSLEYGTEQIHEEVFDWMLERDIIVALDEDGWLE